MIEAGVDGFLAVLEWLSSMPERRSDAVIRWGALTIPLLVAAIGSAVVFVSRVVRGDRIAIGAVAEYVCPIAVVFTASAVIVGAILGVILLL